MQIWAQLNSWSHNEKKRERKGGNDEKRAPVVQETVRGKIKEEREARQLPERDDEKRWKTRMDEDEGSRRWNGQIKAWVPRANRGGQVFSPELRPRSTTFHQLQDEIARLPWASNGSGREDLFSVSNFLNTLAEADYCSSNVPRWLLFYGRVSVEVHWTPYRSFALADSHLYSISIIASCHSIRLIRNCGWYFRRTFWYQFAVDFFRSKGSRSRQFTDYNRSRI